MCDLLICDVDLAYERKKKKNFCCVNQRLENYENNLTSVKPLGFGVVTRV